MFHQVTSTVMKTHVSLYFFVIFFTYTDPIIYSSVNTILFPSNIVRQPHEPFPKFVVNYFGVYFMVSFSFLHKKKQKTYSDLKETQIGVPQSSVLGPIQYLNVYAISQKKNTTTNKQHKIMDKQMNTQVEQNKMGTRTNINRNSNKAKYLGMTSD